MNVRLESIRAAELYALKVRWALIAAAGLLLGERILDPAVLALLLFLVGGNLYALSMAKDVSTFEARGARVTAGLRVMDALLVTGSSSLFPATHNLWALTVPILVAQAIATRSSGKVFALAGLMAAVQLGSSLLFAQPQLPAALSAIGGGAGLALVLAWFQTRDEILAARNSRLSTVLACGSALGSNSNLNQTVVQTLRSAVLETGASCGYVMLLAEDDRDVLVTEAAYSASGSFPFPEKMAVGDGLSGYVARMGQPIAVSSEDGGEQELDGSTADVKAAVSVPLVTRGFGASQSSSDQVLGVLTLLDLKAVEAFTSEDMELLQALCSLLAVAVSNARMEERRRYTFLRTLESLATALEARDEYTRGHSQRVCEVSLMIGERMGLGHEALEELRVGTILHDIGKIGVPDAILNKRGRLSDQEFDVMRQHPVIGYEICRPLMLSEGVLMIIRNHHEKLDGTGYPDGLKGGELPLSLRIVCVADAFDAMSSRRPYRSVMDPAHVQAELSRGAGTQFDPLVVETLRELLSSDRLQNLYRSFWEPEAESDAA